MKVFKMDNVEILEAEIKRKIVFIQNFLLKLNKIDNEIVEDIPKYLDSISSLEKENAELKAERNKINEQHSEDLKLIDDLVIKLSKLVEADHAWFKSPNRW